MKASRILFLGFFFLNTHLPAQPVTDFNPQEALQSVLVGDPGNERRTEQGHGRVAYPYYIGTYPVTNAQYAAFLNAVAATDIHGLYQEGMGGEFGGITRSGISGEYSYVATRPQAPVNFVSFFHGARFANWLTNGRPIGAQDTTTTEAGIYDMSIPVNTFDGAAPRDETVWDRGGVGVARMNEWMKAAYYDPELLNSEGTAGTYWLYPTQSNSAPAAIGPNDTNPNSANYGNAVGNTTDVGSYSLARSHYGTLDQGGNVAEIVGLRRSATDDVSIYAMGGAFGEIFTANSLASTFGGFPGSPTSTSVFIGFRLTSLRPLPDPNLIVTTTQDIVNPGDGQVSLREAVAYAATLSGQPLIRFSETTARGAVNFHDGTARSMTLSGSELLISGDLEIKGPGAQFLSIGGNRENRIFRIAGGMTVTLSDLTLTSGFAESRGGALLNEGILTVNRIHFFQNGLVLAEEPDPPPPLEGGAIYNTGILNVTNSSFANNGALRGGAIYNDGVLTALNSTFAYNEALEGGAIYNHDTLTMTHATLAANTADLGGALFLMSPVINTGIKNTLIADTVQGVYTSQGNNLVSASASNAGLLVDPPGNPILADNGGGTPTIALLPQSPALFAAAEVTEIKTDQRGIARSQGGAPDIGAYEAEPTVAVTLSGLTPFFDGSPKAVTVTTDPTPMDVLVTYDGDTFVPTAIGRYNVVALVQNPGQIGRAIGTLEVREIPSLIVTTTQDGLNPTDNRTSLREAIAYAGTLGGTPTVTFSNTADLGATNFHDGSSHSIALNGQQIFILSAVDIEGPGADRLTISGEGLSRVFYIQGAFDSTFSDLTIANGLAKADFFLGSLGGGISSYDTRLTLNHCVLRDNRSLNDGGGIGFSGGRMILNHCRLQGNSADGDGGAIYNLVGELILNNSTVTGNSAGADGGGIGIIGVSQDGSRATLSQSTISNNTAVKGGGLYTRGGSADDFEIRNTTFSGNSASNQGGAIQNTQGVIEITHSTITGNSAPAGSGLHAVNDAYSLTRIANSIISGNGSNDLAALETTQRFVSLGHNIVGTAGTNVDFSLDFNQTGDQTDINDPKLGPLAANGGPTLTHALLEGSPAINAAVAVDGVAIDQRGILRPQGSAPDSGAFEGDILEEITTSVTQAPVLNTESGLIQSRITITNPHQTTVSGFVLRITNLPADVQVYNATGVDQEVPVITWRQPLASGESTEFLIEFNRVNQDPSFTPTYEAEYVLLPSLPAGEETPFVVDRLLTEGDGGFIFEWTTEPGKTYEVEYSPDLAVWHKVSPTPTAVSNRIRWKDQGPPQTENLPGTDGKRFYRIILLNP